MNKTVWKLIRANFRVFLQPMFIIMILSMFVILLFVKLPFDTIRIGSPQIFLVCIVALLTSDSFNKPFKTVMLCGNINRNEYFKAKFILGTMLFILTVIIVKIHYKITLKGDFIKI